MAINYTSSLALGQPVTGTESGTWGDDVNNSITSYLDIAIAGTLSLTSASFTANALTLANTQGTSSATNISSTTAQYMVLRVSSLAANVTITAPSVSKLYLVDNTDATYTVTIKASGQSGYTVATSTRALVYYNGTDYVLATANNRNSLSGTLAIAGGGTNATATPTAGAVAYGTGSAYAFTSAGTAGQVLQSNGASAPTWANAATGDVTAAGNNAFTGANTFYNATGQTFAPSSTNDGIVVNGRAGGSSSYRVTLTPTTLSASRTLTLPDATTTVVGTDVSQTLTNKTLTNPTVTNYTETPVTANTGTTYTIDITNGTIQILTLTGNCTFTFPTATSGKSFVIFLKQDATGSRTVTWAASVKWPGGTAPTITATASRQDIYSFFADGTNWYGVTIGQNYTP